MLVTQMSVCHTVSRIMWAQKEEKEFWLNWLNRYKSLRCLWDDDAKREAGRTARQAAYQELADLAKRINANADIAFVRGRINAFRTCYRREMRKVQAAQQNGCNYEPQLFYYKALDFLNDSSEIFDTKIFSEDEEHNHASVQQNTQKMCKTSKLVEKTAAMKQKLNDCLSSDAYTFDAFSNDEANYMPRCSKLAKAAAIDFSQTPKEKRKFLHTEIDDSFDCEDLDSKHSMQSMANTRLNNKNDEYDILGKRIAAHFRSMTLNQRLLAEKIITDVCIYGRMEKLTLDSSVFIDSTEGVEQIHAGRQQDVDYDNPDTFIYTT